MLAVGNGLLTLASASHAKILCYVRCLVSHGQTLVCAQAYCISTHTKSLQNTLNWPNLQNRKIYLTAIMLYKIINNFIGIPEHSLLLHNSSYSYHHHHCYKTPYSRISAHLFSFFPFSIRIWNHLSPQTACSPSLKTFKDRISKENLPTRFIPDLKLQPIFQLNS